MEAEERKERKRIRDLKKYEEKVWQEGYKYIAGIDEVGRGPLAGPVVAAAVIMPRKAYIAGINDSKKLSPAKRSKLAVEIKNTAYAWSVAAINPPYLDDINILNATKEAMTLAVNGLHPQPDFLLIDALKLPDVDVQQLALVKGDNLSFAIACASILAKVERDASMEFLDLLYPGYGFKKHKGYATREHIEALMLKGPCSIHRSSFEPVKSLMAGGIYKGQPVLFDQDDA